VDAILEESTMPMDAGRRVRGYRPSRYGPQEQASEEAEVVRLSNLEVYAKRASAGLPIFEDPPPGRSRNRRYLSAG
jgi:hypothetical protein